MLAFLLVLGSLFAAHAENAAGTSDVPSLQQTLAAKKWQRRVVLLYAQSADNVDLLAQQRLLEKDRAGLNERDFDVLVALGTSLSDADRRYLRGGDRRLASSATFTAYLIGKDGGVKQRFTKPVAAAELFKTVDTMPMRQQEMRRAD